MEDMSDGLVGYVGKVYSALDCHIVVAKVDEPSTELFQKAVIPSTEFVAFL